MTYDPYQLSNGLATVGMLVVALSWLLAGLWAGRH